MLRVTFGLLLMLSLAAPAGSELISVAGNVSGVWDADTVLVTGEIRVPAAQVLTIDPGVSVLFTGRHRLIVEGLLSAVGTQADRIVFTRAQPTEGSKWRGIRFVAADDGSLMEHCLIEWARGDEADWSEVRGGAVWIDHCSPTLRRCEIRNSYSHNANSNGAGAGICVNEYSYSLIEGNHIHSNQGDSGSGVFVGSSSNPQIKGNLIEGNTAFYAGGGIYVAAGAGSVIRDNVIRSNTAGGFGGGGINLWSATWLYGTFSYVTNNLIVQNSAGADGGGIYSRYETSQLVNNTLWGNTAQRGGGLYVLTFSDLPPVVHDGILYGNSAPLGAQIYLDPAAASTALITYCDVQGGWAGQGNMNQDPRFVTGSDGDFYLSQTAAGQPLQSPCVNAGNTGSPLIAGATRTDRVPDAGVVDMGFHYEAMTTGVDAAPAADPPGGMLTAHPNPFNPATTLAWRDLPAGPATLGIYTVEGRRVRELVVGFQAGAGEIRWNGRDEGGRPLASGLYLARISADGAGAGARLVLLK